MAAIFLDTICRLPATAYEANDAVSADTQVHMPEAPGLPRWSEKECPQVWIKIPPSRRPKQWDPIDEPVGSP